MSTVQAPERQSGPVAASGDTVRRTDGVSLARLTLVELRKLADTRAGLWLLIVIGLAAAATGAILLLAAPDQEQTFREFFVFAQLPPVLLLPVLGILSMTGEWSQRTALTTFALVPRRGRVIAAKLAAAVLIAVLATAASALFAVLGNALAVATGGDGSWSIPWQIMAQCLVLQVLFALMGSAFGALLMNSPLAIVLYFALPTVWTILTESIRALRTPATWLDINVTTLPMTETAMTAGQWGRLGVSVAVWVLLPLALGTARVLRREVS